MIHTKRNRAGNKLGSVQQALADAIRAGGTEFADRDLARGMLSMESLDDNKFHDLERGISEMRENIKQIYSGVGLENLTEAQIDAGVVAASAAGDLGSYAKHMVSNLQPKGGDNIRVVDPTLSGMGGVQDFRAQASMEAFDEQELRAHLPFSIAFNVQAARQDDFAEAFYPTVVLTPDQAGLDIVIRRTTVFNEVRHKLAGSPADFGKRNLIDAVIEADILASDSIKAIPVFTDGTNNAYFVDTTNDVAPTTVTVDGTEFDTAPLKMGTELDLLGLSSHPGLLAAGVMDNSDALDARIALKTLYLKVRQGGGDGEGGVNADTASVIALNVDRMPFSAFTRPAEGNYRDMVLNFRTSILTVDAATKDVDGAASAFANVGANKVVRLRAEVTGRVNVETGKLKISQTDFAIDSVWTKDANGVPQLDADQAASIAAVNASIADLIDMSLIGYDLYATRSNANRRQRGLLIDVTEEVERHTVMMGSPITIMSPVTAQRDGSDLTAAVNAARIRNSNQAVTTLLNYADMLGSLQLNAADRTADIPMIEGAGRWLVRPWFEETDLDLANEINSIKSHERAEDVTAALINAIRDKAYRMYRDSGYQPALDAITGGTGEKPTLVIGTDPVLAKHLQLVGDTRLTGVQLDHKLVVSSDKRVYGKIIMSFARQGVQGPDPLTLGTHAWIPELASTVQVSRNGATTKEAQVQPRNRHVNNLPVMAVINVLKLEEALTDKII